MLKHLQSLLSAVLVCYFFTLTANAQTSKVVLMPGAKKHLKGSFYLSWGWNEDVYTDSDIRFTGADYDFKLRDVNAVDRQNRFTAKKFLNPVAASIPQFNFRIGYYIRNDIDIFGGTDHMKYVVPAGQTVRIDGFIRNSETVFDGEYDNDEIEITDAFLDMEHTDGLNFVHVGIRKTHTFYENKWIALGAYETFALGGIYPRSDITLIGMERHNRYNVAGLAFAASGALEVYFWRHFFLQSELKGGFTTMPWVRTTSSRIDQAKQNFWFGQAILQFGGRWSFKRKNK